MPASYSYTLSYDARRGALLSSSYSPRLPDRSQFPVSAILGKLPSLPDSPFLDAPDQPGSPAPPTPPTPGIAPAPILTTDTGGPAVSGLGLGIDNGNDNGNGLPQAQGSDSASDDPRPEAAGGDLLRPSFKCKTQPLAQDASDHSGPSKSKKRYPGSRAVAWWTRFDSKRG